MTPIQGLWIGERLSAMEQCSILSFLAQGHEVHLYTYAPVAGIPAGTVLKDAAEIVGRDQIFQYRDHQSYAGFANLFRYKLLHERGGIWTDLDVICLRRFDFRREHVFAGERQRRRWGLHVASCIIQAPAGSRIMRAAYEDAAARDPTELQWGDTGPRLMHRLVHELGHQRDVEPARTFCPIDHWRWRDALGGGLMARARAALRIGAATYAVHLWSEMWRRAAVDKDARHDPRSLYERTRARLGQS